MVPPEVIKVGVLIVPGFRFQVAGSASGGQGESPVVASLAHYTSIVTLLNYLRVVFLVVSQAQASVLDEGCLGPVFSCFAALLSEDAFELGVHSEER